MTFEWVKTRDGSLTIYSEKYSETYHSISGAFEEAFKKFAIPCKIKGKMKILDICFGLGYNSAAAIKLSKSLKIVGLEKDEEILKAIQKITVPKFIEKEYKIIRDAANKLYYKEGDLEIKIVLGDARETIKTLNEKYDAVFLDPFSPKKNPELWTTEFLSNVWKRMKNGAILTTYSCAKIVRKNLSSVGFLVLDGPIVGRRSPSTIAIRR